MTMPQVYGGTVHYSKSFLGEDATETLADAIEQPPSGFLSMGRWLITSVAEGDRYLLAFSQF